MGMYKGYINVYMVQLNIHLSPQFEKDLADYMRRTGIGQKSEAVRTALREALERLSKKKLGTDFREWRGMALKAPLHAKPRFRSEDDLWS